MDILFSTEVFTTCSVILTAIFFVGYIIYYLTLNINDTSIELFIRNMFFGLILVFALGYISLLVIISILILVLIGYGIYKILRQLVLLYRYIKRIKS